MRVILLAASAMLLVGCMTPNNDAGTNRQEAANATTDDDVRTPEVFRKPPKQFGKWGGYGFGGRY